jgi:hypothetical protein
MEIDKAWKHQSTFRLNDRRSARRGEIPTDRRNFPVFNEDVDRLVEPTGVDDLPAANQ